MQGTHRLTYKLYSRDFGQSESKNFQSQSRQHTVTVRKLRKFRLYESYPLSVKAERSFAIRYSHIVIKSLCGNLDNSVRMILVAVFKIFLKSHYLVAILSKLILRAKTGSVTEHVNRRMICL